MKKKSKRTSASRSKAAERCNLFGPLPIVEGESKRAYNTLFGYVFDAVKPANFIEEIWTRQLADVGWTIFRLQRILAAFVEAKVSEAVNDEANSIVEAEPELMTGTDEEKREMREFFDSEMSFEARVALYPRADEKYQKL